MDKTTKIDTSVVNGVHLASIGALTKIREQFPELMNTLTKSKRPSSDWNFFMTAAGVSLAIILSSDENKDSLIQKVSEIDKQIPSAINNFFEFKQSNSEEDVCSELGVWVLWNIGGECPTHPDCYRLAPVIGNFLKNVVKDFIINDKIQK